MTVPESLPGERWLPVVGYEGLYEVSDQGRIWSISRNLMRKPNRTGNHGLGSFSLQLSRNGVPEACIVGRLVLEAFEGPCPEGQECCHDDDNPENNNWPSNLRWDTRSANQFDRVRNGRHHQVNKTECPQGHEYTEENTRLIKNGKVTRRVCVFCARKRTREYMRKRYGHTPRKVAV